ncbi:DUF2877 domain-containing protein [Escherichia coli]|nr:DUF2877 domain-containing protein [Escherichia coli]
MTIIHPLLASRSAPNYRQSWRLAGVWRRAINLMTESGELLTLHRQGSGFGPGGWVLRRAQFDALCGGLCGNERPQVVAQGIRLGRFTVKQPQRYCLLRITPPAHPQPLAVAWMQRAEETGLFGPLVLAASDPLPAELRQFRHCFQAALNGVKTDWRHWLGKGPGLTPSHDDTLSGMLLAAWYYGALDARSGRPFFACSGNLQLVTTAVSVSYLRYAAQGYFASPLLHFVHALSCPKRTAAAIDSLLALGHTSGADTLLGFWLGQQLLQGKP